MTISNQSASVTYTGNSVQTTFTYNFLIPYQSDEVTPAVAVYLVVDDVATLLPPSSYAITGVASPLGGTVIYSPAIDASTQIRIDRALAYTQPMEFLNQGFYPATVEELADDLVMMIQQLAASLGLSTSTQAPREAFGFALMDDSTTEITVTGIYIHWTQPYDFNVDEIIVSVTDSSSIGDITFDMYNNGVSILDAGAVILEGETDCLTNPTSPVVTSPSLLKGDKVTLLITATGTGAKGPKFQYLGRQS